MIAEENFQNDPAIREQRLKDFRKRIKTESSFPTWMISALTDLQNSFPPAGDSTSSLERQCRGLSRF